MRALGQAPSEQASQTDPAYHFIHLLDNVPELRTSHDPWICMSVRELYPARLDIDLEEVARDLPYRFTLVFTVCCRALCYLRFLVGRQVTSRVAC